MKRRGFTLVELLVAMCLSAIVLSLAIGIYKRQERAFSVQSELSERQQNVRIAMEMITRDLRMAGSGTSFQTTPTLDLDGDGSVDSLILAATDNIAAATDNIADGTDVLTIVYAGFPHKLRTGEFAQGNNIVLNSLDFDGDGIDDIGRSAWPNKDFGILHDLSRGVTFKTTSTARPLTTTPAVGDFPAGAYVCPLHVVRYWVDNEATGADDALDPVMPRLMRRDYGRDQGPETVAENIIALQVQYGLDRDHDGNIDADGWVNDFSVSSNKPEDVVAVRVWVLGQNPTPRPGTTDRLEGVVMGNAPALGPSLNSRELLQTELRLRNRR
jgi:prepilin-type N-terminal cleavage/methylation domain-containing protein